MFYLNSKLLDFNTKKAKITLSPQRICVPLCQNCLDRINRIYTDLGLVFFNTEAQRHEGTEEW